MKHFRPVMLSRSIIAGIWWRLCFSCLDLFILHMNNFLRSKRISDFFFFLATYLTELMWLPEEICWHQRRYWIVSWYAIPNHFIEHQSPKLVSQNQGVDIKWQMERGVFPLSRDKKSRTPTDRSWNLLPRSQSLYSSVIWTWKICPCIGD